MRKRWIAGTGALLVGIGVALGAVAAHALKASLDERYFAAFKTGADYQLWMGLGLLALSAHTGSQRLHGAGALLILIGTLLFSVSLYILALTQWTPAAYVTPIGGVLMIVGWIMAAISLMRAGE